jgi:TonB family protein
MKNTISTVLFCLFLLFVLWFKISSTDVFAQTAKQETVEQILENANALLLKNQVKEAKKAIEKALKQDKNSAEAYLFLSVAYKQENNRDKAIKQARKALKLRPNFVNAHYILAVLFYETYEIKKSEEELNIAFQQGASFLNAYVLKGLLAMERQNFPAALEAYQEANRLNPVTAEDTANLREMIPVLENLVEFEQRKKDKSYHPPKPLNRPRPAYTEEARSKKISGLVRIRALVDEQGDVKSCVVLRRLDLGLDVEAIKAVRKMKFSPALKDNTPIAYWLILEVEFQLR